MRVVKTIASHISIRSKLPPGVTFDDLVSWGVEGLIKAREKYIEKKGATFKTYANFRVKGEILDNLRKEWGYRTPQVYKNYQEKIKERIAQVIEGSIESNVGNKKPMKERVHDLLSHSAMTYLVSIDDETLSHAIEAVEDSSVNIQEDIEVKEEKSWVWKEIEALEPIERQIVKLFYIQGLNQKEIAKELKVSGSKICRLHVTILEKLKRRLERRYEE